MLKRLIHYSFWIFSSLIFLFIYEVYFGENRFSIALNQGLTDVPYNVDHVTVKRRRGLYCVLTGYDASTASTCTTSKESFTRWLKTAKFQVIYFTPEGSSETTYYSTIGALPRVISNNLVHYTIQVEGGNSKTLAVYPLDEKNLFLKFCSDWN